MSETPKTLAEALDASGGLDDVAARRLAVLLGLFDDPRLPSEDRNSEPLEVKLP